MTFGHDIPRVDRYTAMTFPSHSSYLSRIFWILILLNGKMQFLFTCKVSRYYLMALHGSRPLLGTNVCTMAYVAGDSPLIARRVNIVPLCAD